MLPHSINLPKIHPHLSHGMVYKVFVKFYQYYIVPMIPPTISRYFSGRKKGVTDNVITQG